MPRVSTIRGLGQDDPGLVDLVYSGGGSDAGGSGVDPALYDQIYGGGSSAPSSPSFAPTGYNVTDVVNTETPRQVPGGTLIPGTTPSQLYAAASQVGNVIQAATTGTTGLGPSPKVQVPLNSSSFGLFLESATLIPGVPNVAVVVGGLALAIALAASGGRRRR